MLSEAANSVKGSFVGFIMPRPPNLVRMVKIIGWCTSGQRWNKLVADSIYTQVDSFLKCIRAYVWCHALSSLDFP